MKKQIRRGVFETNSSSVHSVTMCMESDYEKWNRGELLFNEETGEFRTEDDVNKIIEDNLEDIYPSKEVYRTRLRAEWKTVDEFWDTYDYMDNFEEKFTTSNGDEVIAFGYYGHD